MQLSSQEKSDLFHKLPLLRKLEVMSYVPGLWPKLKYIWGSQIEVPDLSKADGHWNPIHYAAYSGDVTFVPMYQKLGVDIDAKDENGLTPIMLTAFHFNDLNAFFELIRLGANLDVKDNQGDALIHRAIKEGHSDVVAVLLQRAQQQSNRLNLRITDKQGHTPLALAGQFNLPQHLLEELRNLSSRAEKA